MHHLLDSFLITSHLGVRGLRMTLVLNTSCHIFSRLIFSGVLLFVNLLWGLKAHYLWLVDKFCFCVEWKTQTLYCCILSYLYLSSLCCVYCLLHKTLPSSLLLPLSLQVFKRGTSCNVQILSHFERLPQTYFIRVYHLDSLKHVK